MKKTKFLFPVIGLSTIATVTPCIVSCANNAKETLNPLIKAKAYADIANDVSESIAILPEAEGKIKNAANWLYDCLDTATINEQCIAIGLIGAGTKNPVFVEDITRYEMGIIRGIAKQPEAEEKLSRLMKLSTNIIMNLTDPAKIYAIGVGTATAMDGISTQPEAEQKIVNNWIEMIRHVLAK